jgi:hypothetical protein
MNGRGTDACLEVALIFIPPAESHLRCLDQAREAVAPDLRLKD